MRCPHCKTNQVENPELRDVCDSCDQELHEEYMASVMAEDRSDHYDDEMDAYAHRHMTVKRPNEVGFSFGPQNFS